MLSFLIGLIDPVTRIADLISKAVIARDNAKTDQERIAADERVKTLQAKRDVLVAKGSSWFDDAIRALFALPFVIYNGKLVVWDKVLNLGSTDPLSPELFQVEVACIGFYFLHSIVTRVFR